MLDLLPSWPLFVAFCAASVVLAVTPGPGVLYIVTRSLAHGRSAGFASVAGIALGNFGNALGASVGLAALFAVSSFAFTVVKLAGAGYLVWLGIRTLAGRGRSAAAEGAPTRNSTRRVARDGFFVALLNPKTALFFAAFLPQFMSSEAPAMAQAALLGALFVAIAMVSDTLYVLSARAAVPLVARAGRSAGRYLSGSVFIGLGILTAFAGNRSR